MRCTDSALAEMWQPFAGTLEKEELGMEGRQEMLVERLEAHSTARWGLVVENDSL